jgi:nucleotide-binding universal stress UspA family protein
MYRKILVPLDGSNLSTGVLPYVRYLARALHIPVELLYVDDPALMAPRVPALAEELFTSVAKSFSPGVKVVQILENGSPARVIIDRAGSEPNTLVTMATHGYSGAARWLLGSVAEKVSHGIASDLILLRPEHTDTGHEITLRTVLVPLDFSDTAEAILPTVAELARLLKLEILLVHVTKRFYPGPPETFAPTFGAIPNLKELWEQDSAAANAYLSEKAEELRNQGLPRVELRALAAGVDGAAGEIVDLAQQVPDSFIAMTPQGQSPIDRWLMGSVTKRVIQSTKRPVLVVRSPRQSGTSAS